MSRKSLLGGVLAIPLSMTLASTGAGAVVPLGDSGWSAIWSDSAYTSLQVVYESEDATKVHLRIIDEFNPTSLNLAAGLNCDAHSIVFYPTSASAVLTLSIDVQQQSNAIGHPWDGWRMTLLGPGAAFDAQSAADWQDAHFALATYETQDLHFAGSWVMDGQTWTAGGGTSAMLVQVTPDASGKLSPFSLTQRPMLTVIPEPSMGLLAAGMGMLLLRRVRRP